jgi:hypothetical protein
MGLQTPHALGRDQRVFTSVQTAFDTFVRPIAAHAIRAKAVEFTPENERIPRDDNRPTRSQVQMVTGAYKVSWKITCYLRSSGALGVAPDEFDLWTGAFGSESLSVGTSVSYGLNSAQAARMFSITKGSPGVMFDAVVGAVVGKFALKLDGAKLPEVTFEGPARRRILAAPFTLQTGTAAAIWVATNNEGVAAASVDALYALGANDNAGAGWRVNAVGAPNSASAGFLNVTAEGAHGMAPGGLLTPFLPAETVATAAPVSGAFGSLTWGPLGFTRDTMRLVSLDLEIDNAPKVHGDEALTRFASDVTFGTRVVKGTARVRLTQANAAEAARNLNAQFQASYNPIALTFVIGTAAGAIFTFSIPRAEIGSTATNSPGPDEAIVEIPFTALASAETANDEISLVIT